MEGRYILSTGLTRCYNNDGLPIDCRGTGQDAEFHPGLGWPAERFETIGNHLTDLPWRMPTINELESLVDASTHHPALPEGHPFTDARDAYWSSTTSFFAADWSYILYLEKGAVGVGYKKNRDFTLWPVMEAEKINIPERSLQKDL